MRFLATLILSLLTTALAWADATFRLTAPSAVAVGQQFRVEYTVTARASGISVDLGDKGFEVLYGPSSSSSQRSTIVNGQMCSEYRTTFTYVLKATKAGTFQLPAATIKIDGQTLTSNSASIKVLPADKQSSAQPSSGQSGRSQQQGGAQAKFNKDDVHLVLDLSKTSAYEGEAVVATLKLYWRNTQMGNPTEVKLPDFEGFFVQGLDNDNAQANLEHYQGVKYQTYPLARWQLFPLHSGKLIIPTASLKSSVQIVTTRSSGGFFDWPMEYTQNVEVPLQTAPRIINVKPLPAGMPPHYINAVGQLSAYSELSQEDCFVQDTIHYRLIVEGKGNIHYVLPPHLESTDAISFLQPRLEVVEESEQTRKGKKIFDYPIIVTQSGLVEIPSIEFVSFNPESNKYELQHTRSYTVKAKKRPLFFERNNFKGTFSQSSFFGIQSLAKTVILLDVSNSMQFEDLIPSRLEACKAELESFVRNQEQTIFGINLFAKGTTRYCSIGTNADSVIQKIHDVSFDIIDGSSTAIGDGLLSAINSIRDHGSDISGSSIILITDGSNNSGSVSPLTAVQIAKSFGIRINSIGICSTEEFEATVGYDPFDRPVKQRVKPDIDDSLLQTIADRTGGEYHRATSKASLSSILENLQSVSAPYYIPRSSQIANDQRIIDALLEISRFCEQ